TPAEASPAPPPAPASDRDWLALFDPTIRAVFEHLSIHSAITEAEATRMLGGARAFRKFSRDFEELARKAPFAVTITTIHGVKRYTRE
ncbi:MAG TPA: hypothetical protein PKW35_01710, partial [Nannocystaceae bacterium]|nr:hypothetical protein [Nannocystaceae bacterium]